ncbi:unnamed protein product [Sphagnum troendelagicum]
MASSCSFLVPSSPVFPSHATLPHSSKRWRLPAFCEYVRVRGSMKWRKFSRDFSSSPAMLLPLTRVHNRGQWGDSSSRRKQLLCTRCYLDEAGGMSSSLEAKKNQAGAKKSSSTTASAGAGEKAMPVQEAEASTSGTLYPPSVSHKKGYLEVSSLHTIYYEVFGNPKGRPVVFLHGGPGAGCSERHARFFDPQHYRIVLFDQRGCGKSSPRGSLENNTTWDLVADIEKLRLQLGVTRWMVMGGSWGVTLALAYAQSHPKSVAALILRGVCLLRPQEIDWFYKQGANALFPFGWEELLSVLESSERNNILSSYYRRLTSSDTSIQQQAAQAWLRWEMGLSFFSTSPFVVSWDGQQYLTIPSPLVAPEVTQESSNQTRNGKSRGRLTGSSPSSSQTETKTAPSSSSSSGTSSRAQPSINQSQSNKINMSSQLAQARLECHYFVNGGFLEDNQLLLGIPKMQSIPGIIVQGRYDFVCPLVNAFDLHRAWPEAQLRIVPNAGHSMYEQGIMDELLRATETFKQLEY